MSVLDDARAAAARVWRYRHQVELEAAERFRVLAAELANFGVSEPIVGMTRRAASDELRHAEHCADLVRHFGGTLAAPSGVTPGSVAPRVLSGRERLLYDVVALACVTETLSTALLGVLVDRSQDPVAKRVLQSILRDEVGHSRLGWAFLAEEHARGARDCVSEWLPAMLSATLSEELFMPTTEASALDTTLAGFGALERAERRRVVREALSTVIFPGLERFGIDARRGRAWLSNELSVHDS